MILKHQGLVRMVADRMVSRMPVSVTADDLASAGVLGLIDAATRFSESKGRFEPFAVTRIKGAMLDELREMDWVPRKMLQLESLGLDDHHQDMLDGRRILEDPAGGTWLRDIEERDAFARRLVGLRPDEKIVLAIHYRAGLTMREIGELVGLSESRICQIRARALNFLRQMAYRREARAKRSAAAND